MRGLLLAGATMMAVCAGALAAITPMPLWVYVFAVAAFVMAVCATW